MNKTRNEVLLFDVFGTLLDWHGSIGRIISRNASNVLTPLQGVAFAVDWAHGYGAAVAAVNRGDMPFEPLDKILEDAFEAIVRDKGVGFSDGQKSLIRHAWDELEPWDDVLPGMDRLREKYVLCAFSNANRSLMERIAAFSGIPFDVILSAEDVRRYKPDPAVYQNAIRHFGCVPSKLTLIASHTFDLNAAADHGINTALVFRKQEPGGDVMDMRHPLDWLASDLGDLADQMLGASYA